MDHGAQSEIKSLAVDEHLVVEKLYVNLMQAYVSKRHIWSKKIFWNYLQRKCWIL